MKRTAVFILLFLIFMPAGAWAKDKKIVPSSAEGIKVVIAEGKAVLGDDRTPAQAKAIAMNNARRNALEEAVGVNLHSSTLVYNSQLIASMNFCFISDLFRKHHLSSFIYSYYGLNLAATHICRNTARFVIIFFCHYFTQDSKYVF